MTSLKSEIFKYLISEGASDVGFCTISDAPAGLSGAISIVVRLSDAIIDEITDAPTYTYFHHYRTANAFLDRLALRCGLFLQKRGHNYFPIGASQSSPSHLGSPYSGRYSHKKVACTAGLGAIGKNGLFLHRDFGARVRLVTVFCDCEFPSPSFPSFDMCSGCDKCVAACPAGAISGKAWSLGEEGFFNPEACSKHMKEAYQNIGRGAVCGICMRVCPAHKKG